MDGERHGNGDPEREDLRAKDLIRDAVNINEKGRMGVGRMDGLLRTAC